MGSKLLVLCIRHWHSSSSPHRRPPPWGPYISVASTHAISPEQSVVGAYGPVGHKGSASKCRTSGHAVCT